MPLTPRTAARSNLCGAIKKIGAALYDKDLATGATPKPVKVDISRNENPYGLHPEAKKAAIDAIDKAHLYPDPTSKKVRQTLAKMHNVNASQVIIAPGSEAILSLLPQVKTDKPSGSMVFPKYSFYRYQSIAQAAGRHSIQTKETVQDGVDMEDLLKASQAEGVQIAQLVNPTNPTGQIIKKDDLKELIKNLSDDILFVYDIAYSEYCTDPDFSNGIEFIKNHPNMLVLGTLSKAYAMGGMRIGYAIGSDEVIDSINKVRSGYFVSRPSQDAADVALNNTADMRISVARTLETKGKFQEELDKLNLPYTPSHTNFVLIEFGKNGWPSAEQVDQSLRSRGIIVRPMTEGYELTNHLRFSIGTNDEMSQVVNALYEIKNTAEI